MKVDRIRETNAPGSPGKIGVPVTRHWCPVTVGGPGGTWCKWFVLNIGIEDVEGVDQRGFPRDVEDT